MASRAFLGAGDLYIARIVGGVVGNYEGPFECSKFEIKPNVEKKEQVSKGRSSYGQVIESVSIPKPAELTVNLTEIDKNALAIAMFGTTASVAQSASALSESVTGVLNAWVPFTKVRLDPAVPVTSAGLVEGTDYLINYTLGWVKALTAGAVGAHTYAGAALAVTGTEIAGMTSTNVRSRFKLDGKNFADDLPVQVTVYEAVIAADSAFDFLADDFNELSLPGSMKTPTGFLAPFHVRVLNEV
jgi:hypothetical protein